MPRRVDSKNSITRNLVDQIIVGKKVPESSWKLPCCITAVAQLFFFSVFNLIIEIHIFTRSLQRLEIAQFCQKRFNFLLLSWTFVLNINVFYKSCDLGLTQICKSKANYSLFVSDVFYNMLYSPDTKRMTEGKARGRDRRDICVVFLSWRVLATVKENEVRGKLKK